MTPQSDELLDLRKAVLGATGSGKTYMAKGEVERLLTLKRRLCIVDPLGVWYGLRLAPDGVAKGFDIPVLGGKHGDMQITEFMGEQLGKIVATNDFSCIIDLSLIRTKAAWRRFMVDFLEALYDHNSEPLHLILDEADLWAPQKLVTVKGEGNALLLFNRVDEIARRGRVKGFIVWLISQRPAVLNKDVLSQAEVLVAMQLPSPQDRGAIKDWIEGQADRDAGKAVLANLAQLPTGEGYVWAPRFQILERMKFPLLTTYDSSRTPQRGEKVQGVTLPKIELSTIASALSGADGAAPPAKGGADQRADKDALAAAERRGYAAGAASRNQEVKELQDRLHHQNTSIRMAYGYLGRHIADGEIIELPPEPKSVETAKPVTSPVIQAKKPDKIAEIGEIPEKSPGDVSRGAEARMLNALRSRYPRRLTEVQWATFSIVRRKSSTWRNCKSRLKTQGLVATYDGLYGLTPEGALGVNVVKRTPAEQIAAWRGILGGGAAVRMFDALVAVGSNGAGRGWLATTCDVDPSSSTFRNALSKLRSNELIDVTKTHVTLAASLLEDLSNG